MFCCLHILRQTNSTTLKNFHLRAHVVSHYRITQKLSIIRYCAMQNFRFSDGKLKFNAEHQLPLWKFESFWNIINAHFASRNKPNMTISPHSYLHFHISKKKSLTYKSWWSVGVIEVTVQNLWAVQYIFLIFTMLTFN